MAESVPDWVQEIIENTGEKLNKLFIGGLSAGVKKDDLHDAFSKYGILTDCVAMQNRETGQGRGFGFVTFKEEASLRAALSDAHNFGITIDNRKVDCRRAVPRESDAVNHTASSRVFVGGLKSCITEGDLRDYFESFPGICIKEISVVDKNNNRFAFIEFETRDNADFLVTIANFNVPANEGKRVDVKKAYPKGQEPPKKGGFRNERSGRGSSRDYYPRKEEYYTDYYPSHDSYYPPGGLSSSMGRASYGMDYSQHGYNDNFRSNYRPFRGDREVLMVSHISAI